LKKLVAYITTCYPDCDFTVDAALALKEAGVDTLELGIPFSDPVADGPVIERANLEALESGFKIADLFEVSSSIAKEIDTLWMGYMNPFYHKGFDLFIGKAKEYQVSGFIIPDLPFEEAKEFTKLCQKNSLHNISFVAPTDSKKRIKTITQDSSKFIYLVAYAGITGSGASEDLSAVIQHIKSSSQTPIYTGFGVNAKTANEKSKDVDGVIVGSAFVSIMLDNSLGYDEKISKMQELAKVIKEEINS
jgi:tryptophan synthase alpha chain